MAVLLSAFRINPDGTTGPAVGSGSVGICECIRLRMQINYVTPGPSGGKVAFFEGGTMTVSTISGTFTDNVTPAGGVPLIGNPADPNAATCGPGATPTFLSDFSQDYCVQPSDIIGGNVTFLAQYIAAMEFFGAGIPNQPTGTTAISIHVDQGPACSIVTTPQAICQGASATFTVTGTGAAAPFTFTWAGPNGFTGSGDTITINNAQPADAGTYTATVTDAHGCTSTCTASLTVNPNPTCTVTPPSAEICAGAPGVTFTVNPAGGTPGYTYLWSSGETTATITTSVAGTYTVTVTDAAGCTTTCSGTLTVNPNPTCTVTPPSAEICAGAPGVDFTVNPAGGTPGYTFLWNTGETTATITKSAAGTYSVTVTDSKGCTTTCSATLTVNPNPTCTVSPPTATICAGAPAVTFTVNPAGGTPGYTYLWDTGETTQTISKSAAGTYTATVTDSKGCTTTCSATLIVNPCAPVVNITKVIACWLGNNGSDICGTFGASATGVKVGSTCPKFCYKITVSNPGPVDLENVLVTDPTLGINQTIPSLLVGASQDITASTTLCSDTVNTATAQGTSTVDHTTQTPTVTATANAYVVPINISCVKLVSVDGSPAAATAEIPQDGAAHTVVYTVTVTNPNVAGDANHPAVDLNVAISDPACGPIAGTTLVAAGQTATLPVCTLQLTCPLANPVNTVTVTATVAQPGAGAPLCDIGPNGDHLTVSSTCQSTLTCKQLTCVSRTQGYWFNHVIGAQGCATLDAAITAAGGSFNLGFTTVDLNQALGYFWTKGKNANALCAARQKAATQLIAAIANVVLLNEQGGCIAGTDLITRAQAALASCNISDINAIQSELDAFNNAGDNLDFPAGLRPCSAGKDQKAYIDTHAVAPGSACNTCAP